MVEFCFGGEMNSHKIHLKTVHFYLTTSTTTQIYDSKMISV